MRVKPLNSTELKQFLDFAERTAYFASDVDCSPLFPEQCLASAACVILQRWLPGEIKWMEKWEQEEAAKVAWGDRPIPEPNNWPENHRLYKTDEISFDELCERTGLMGWQANRLMGFVD